MYEEITSQASTAISELLEQAKLKPGSLLVIGCSSSEMVAVSAKAPARKRRRRPSRVFTRCFGNGESISRFSAAST